MKDPGTLERILYQELSRRRFLALAPSVMLPFVLPACGEDDSGTAAFTYEPVESLTEPELVTVSDTEAVFTWVTDSMSDTHVFLGSGGTETHHDLSGPPARYHHAYIDGLPPGTTFSYRLQSGGRDARVGQRSPGRFSTLETPPGEYLFSFATLNDTHVGEHTAGLICLGDICLNEGFQSPWPEHPYWEFTNQAVVKAINQKRPDFVIHKGDVSAEYLKEEFLTAKGIFDRFRMPYHVLRGNHDRVGDHEQDFFRTVFGLEQTHHYFLHHEHLFILLDSSNLETGLPEIREDQFRWLDEVLASYPGRRVLVFLHHAVTRDAQFFALAAGDRNRLVQALAQHGGVVGVFSGHSHRACVTYEGLTGHVPYVETPSTKEYPGGFCLYRVYTGGYMQTFYRSPCARCLAWFELTKGEYWGLAPLILFGDPTDRNFVFRYGASR
jgi:predicted phosphodiesterase